MKRLTACIFLCLLASWTWADSQHEVIQGFGGNLPSDSGINAPRAAFANPEAASKFVENVLKNPQPEYCIIHVLRWAEPKQNGQEIQAQNWYLFRRTTKGWSQEDFTTRRHIAGAKQVYIAFVHLNKQHDYEPRYVVDITKKLPSNVAHLLALIGAFAGGATPAPPRAALAVSADRWGGAQVKLKYVPSTVKVAAFQQIGDGALAAALGEATFDNEGPMYWDVSIAVPLRKISLMKLDTSTGTASPIKVGDQSVFAAVDGYLPGLDPSRTIFRKVPHPLAGVAFAKQPLHRVLLGAGWGPSFSELYMGVLWVKQPIGAGGCGTAPAPGTGNPTNRFCRQFAIGVNLQVGSILDQIRFH